MKRLALLGAAAAIALTGCDAISSNDAPALSLAEQEAAADVVASVLSDQSNGFAADLQDAGATLDRGGLSYSAHLLGGGSGGDRGFGGDRFWRPGDRQTGRVTYDSTTGTFRLVYDRTDSTRGFVRTAKANISYQYLTAAGATISDPRRNRSTVHKVVYSGAREGSETGAHRRRDSTGSVVTTGTVARTYKNTASWTLDGLTTATATFAGEQSGEGSMTITRPDSTPLMTAYTATLTSSGVTISKSDSSRAASSRVTGTLAYKVVTTTQRGSGAPTTRTTEGTITLDGNGTALLRFDGLSGSYYRINLRDGSRERREGERERDSH